VLDELQAMVRERDLSIRAMGVAAYACSLLCLEETGAPLTPVYTYADTRSAADAFSLRTEIDELESLQRTGCRIRANYLHGRIAWLRRTQPDVYARTRWFTSLSDFLSLRLFEHMRGGLSVWSWSGLVNRHTRDWDAEWLSRLGISAEQLPVMASPGEWLGPLRPDLAERWPMLDDVLCFPAVGDGAAANVGSGCAGAEHVAVTIGTTGALRIVRPTPWPSPQPSPGVPGEGATSLPSPILTGEGPGMRAAPEVPAEGDQPLPHGLWCYRVDAQRELIGGATTEGGNVFTWLRNTLKLPAQDELEALMGGLPPDAQGLTILPLFAGERSPGYSENSRATLHGLTFDASPEVLARACLEAIAYRLGIIYEDLKTLARPDAVLVASGGALLASPTWCQIIADVTNTPLSVCEETEATGRGVALLVLEQLGTIQSIASLPARLGATFNPDPQRHAVYSAALERQRELYSRLVG
jgi:gluconokinase